MSKKGVRVGTFHHRLGLTLLAAGAAWGTAGSAQGQVHVLQVEADGDTNTAGIQYAAVSFPSTDTVVNGGITFHALSGTTNAYSGHAASVRGSMVPYAGGYISDIYSQTYWDWEWKNISVAGGLGTGGASLIRLPSPNTNNIKVVNHSWITGAYSSVGNDVRTYDYMISRDDLVMASGAVNSGNGDYPLIWSSRNGIAVRGSQYWGTGGQTFRTHPDVYGPDDYAASNTTPEIAGIAAKIIGQGQAAGNANVQHHEVVKSMILSGTSKTAYNTHFTSWTPSLPNNLDVNSGAGIVVSSQVDGIYAGGEKALTPLTSQALGTAIASPAVTTGTSGWSYIPSLAENQQTAVVFQRSTPFTDITATLAWDITSPVITVNGTTGIDTGVDNFANLNLRLYKVDVTGGSYSLGSAVTLAGLVSASTTDNVEHLYYSGAALAAGSYAFVIEYADTPNLANYPTDAGFSYKLVPEPATPLVALAVLAGGMLGRRQRGRRVG